MSTFEASSYQHCNCFPSLLLFCTFLTVIKLTRNKFLLLVMDNLSIHQQLTAMLRNKKPENNSQKQYKSNGHSVVVGVLQWRTADLLRLKIKPSCLNSISKHTCILTLDSRQTHWCCQVWPNCWSCSNILVWSAFLYRCWWWWQQCWWWWTTPTWTIQWWGWWTVR